MIVRDKPNVWELIGTSQMKTDGDKRDVHLNPSVRAEGSSHPFPGFPPDAGQQWRSIQRQLRIRN